MPVKLGVLAKELFKETKKLLGDLCGIEFGIEYQPGPQGNIKDIEEILWPEAFVTQVKIDEILENDFWILIEKKGAIFLSSKMLMLPEKTAEDALKKGELNESMLDAQKEICNMLVGIIDDIFRQRVNDAWHLSQGNSFLYENSSEFLPSQEYVSYVGIVTTKGFEFKIAFILSRALADKIEGKVEEKSKETAAPPEEAEIPSPEVPSQPKPDIFETLILKNSHGLTAEDIAERDFPAIYPEATLTEALTKMEEAHSDYLFVVDGLKLMGIITLADVRGGLSPFLEEPFREYCRPQDEATKRFKISWFMNTEVSSVSPEASLIEVAKVAAEGAKYSIPVCYNGRVIGEIPVSKLITILAKLAFSEESSIQTEAKQIEATKAAIGSEANNLN